LFLLELFQYRAEIHVAGAPFIFIIIAGRAG
jgi:hypothetical protein